MKKFELHLDAVVVIVLVFLLSFSFNFYQRYQYSGLLDKHVGLQLQMLGLQSSVENVKGLIEECLNELDAARQGEPARPDQPAAP